MGLVCLMVIMVLLLARKGVLRRRGVPSGFRKTAFYVFEVGHESEASGQASHRLAGHRSRSELPFSSMWRIWGSLGGILGWVSRLQCMSELCARDRQRHPAKDVCLRWASFPRRECSAEVLVFESNLASHRSVDRHGRNILNGMNSAALQV